MLAGNAANEMIPKLECCKPGDALHRRAPEMIDPDFNALMNFFCFEWRGKSGKLTGCNVPVMPENAEAVDIFSAVGRGASQSDIRTAMELSGVEDFQDCWWRVMTMNQEFQKGKQ